MTQSNRDKWSEVPESSTSIQPEKKVAGTDFCA
jgi:hypothetical protein